MYANGFFARRRRFDKPVHAGSTTFVNAFAASGAAPGPERPRDESESLDDLPPLDGDAKDGPDPEQSFEDPLGDEPGEASLDDSTSEDDPADPGDLEVDEAETGWLNEPADAPDLELGDVAIADFGDETRPGDDETEESTEGELDVGFADGPERGNLDSGDEGPLDADEELREADLPALDADEDGEIDEAALVDAGFAADEPLGLPWAAQPWLRVGAPVPLVAATAVACTLRGAVVCGRAEGGAAELSRIDLEGTCQSLPARGIEASSVRGLAVEGGVIVALVEGAGVLVSRDAGAAFELVADTGSAVDAVVASGTVWLRTRAGELLALDGDTGAAQRSTVPGSVAAIARDDTGIAALVVDPAGRPAYLLRGVAASALSHEPIAGPETGAPALVAARHDHVAYTGRRGGVVRRLAGGMAREVGWEGRVTALAFVDDLGTLVAATYSASDDTSALVRVDNAGKPSVIARVGPASGDAEADGRVVAMAIDEAHGVVWVCGGFGVAAFSIGEPPG